MRVFASEGAGGEKLNRRRMHLRGHVRACCGARGPVHVKLNSQRMCACACTRARGWPGAQVAANARLRAKALAVRSSTGAASICVSVCARAAVRVPVRIASLLVCESAMRFTVCRDLWHAIALCQLHAFALRRPAL